MKRFAALIAIIMLVSVVVACGNKPEDKNQGGAASVAPTAAATAAATAKPEETGKLAEIKKAGKIILGTSADYAPYEFHKNIDGKDTIVGFDIEIAKAIAADIGVKLEIKDMEFGSLLAALPAGKVDFVMAGLTPDDERKKSVDFSKIYYMAEQAILVRAEDKDKFKSMDEFKKASIGVQTGSTQEKLAKEQLDGAQIKSIGKITDLALQLKNKKVDAVIMELPVANGYVKKNTDLVISSVKPKTDEGGSAAAVKKGNADLVAQIDKTLDRLIKEKAVEQFVNEAFLLSEQ